MAEKRQTRSRNAPTARLRDAATWRALRKPFRLRLLEAARASGGISAQALAARVGISPQLMLYHLQLLEKAGLLRHEGGKRARGKGGKFTCTSQGLAFAADPRDAGERRRLDAIVAALESEAREQRDPAQSLQHGLQWECLNPTEVREIERCMSDVATVLARAAARRAASGELPDATHVVSLGMRRVQPGTMPTCGFTCRTTGARGR